MICMAQLTSPPAESHATPKAAATTGRVLLRAFLGALACKALLARGKQGRVPSIFPKNWILVSDTQLQSLGVQEMLESSTLNPEARGISVSSSSSFTLLNFKWLDRKTPRIVSKIWTTPLNIPLLSELFLRRKAAFGLLGQNYSSRMLSSLQWNRYFRSYIELNDAPDFLVPGSTTASYHWKESRFPE